MPIGDNNGLENAYFVDADGKVIGNIDGIQTITMAVTPDDVRPYEIPRDMDITFKWKADKISRKSFCRKLIELGYTKNEAKDIARAINGNYGRHLAVIRWCGKEHVKRMYGGKK